MTNESALLMNWFYERAIIDVDENGNKFLTIGVENWSLYDGFAILNQEKNSEYINSGNSLNTLPSGFFTNYDKLTYSISDEVVSDDVVGAKAAYENSGLAVANVSDSFFYFSNDEKSVTIDTETSKDIDTAYLTFPIENCEDRIYIYTWQNAPLSAINSHSVSSFVSSSIIYLNMECLETIDDITQSIQEGTSKYSLSGATLTTTLPNQQNFFGYAPTLKLFNKSDANGNLMLDVTEKADT